MKCPYCGNTNEQNVSFCTKCGNSIKTKPIFISETKTLISTGIILLLIVLIIFFIINSLPANAKETTVHKWEYQINRACSQYVSTNYTPWDLYNCLIETTRDGFYWQQGWEKPVKADVIMPLTMFQPEVLNLSVGEKQDIAAGYQQTLPKMYLKKLNERKNAHVKFTQQDVNRIWGR